MLTIPQGSNAPILIKFQNELELAVVTAVLATPNNSRTVKKWLESEILIGENQILLQLTQSETSSFPVSNAVLYVKGCTETGDVILFDTINIRIVSRYDKNTIFDPDIAGSSSVDVSAIPVTNVQYVGGNNPSSDTYTKKEIDSFLANKVDQGTVYTKKESDYKYALKGESGSDSSMPVDTALSTTSTNPVQNKVVTSAINELSTRVTNIERDVEGAAILLSLI